MTTSTTIDNRWSSEFKYVLAAAGAAVGLGNLWKFPYIMGENGGGAFVLVYLFCILLIGIPVMMAEVMIGKRSRTSPANASATIAKESGGSSIWSLLGASGVIAGSLILSFYIVIAGWAAAYIFFGIGGDFLATAGSEISHKDEIGALFTGLITDTTQLIIWASITIVAAMLVLIRGVNAGLEKAVTYLMPSLLVLLMIIMVYAAATGNFGEAAQFMFSPDFSKLSIDGVLTALGHAFFTLSLSSGIMMIYGTYMPEGTSIAKTSIWIAIMDTAVALIAGMAIFPIVFANGMEPSAGPGLLFVSLPIAFGQMPLGSLFGTLFFIMVTFAAFTSVIALLESPVAYLNERLGLSRTKATITAGCTIWGLSLLTVFSLSGAPWAQDVVMGLNFFDALDKLTANIMLPLAGLFTAVLVGWVVNEKITREEFGLSEVAYKAVMFCLRYLSPVAIAIVFLQAIGLISL
ncbi:MULTISPECIES: sodium-dependent transporter [unclassified Moritella]|uniref:sodium-dependent transporter n=1 Tax=unclassified Moritella TaxID=2637987 RepID=UPI001BABDB2F|nr:MULTISPECIES: sodium-dependent transporter [unclassified Moritella]QUM86500.1 sodium-dependent transporter [Moritella sp. 28]QUM90725.1 sodium-dependent transporter [Moritella sp. 36]